jgi:hypothetical protein
VSTTVRANTAHHLAADIACTAREMWDYAIANMAEGAMFAGPGHDIEPIGDALAIFKGYRVRMQAGDSAEDVVCHITARDEDAMWLSLYTEAPSPIGEGRMTIRASYRVVPAGDHCHFSVDSHASLNVAVADTASPAEIASAIAAVRTQFDEGLRLSFAGIKAQLESHQGQ